MNGQQQTHANPAYAEISLWSVARLLLSKLHWLLLIGAICGVFVFLCLRFFVTPHYQSRVSFYVYNSSETVMHNGTINNSDLQAAESLANTYSKILGSNSVLDAVLSDLKKNNNELSREELSKMIDVAVINDTQLIEVAITDSDPKFACKIADSFAKVAPKEIVRITKAGGVEVVDRPEIATKKSSPRTVFDTAIGVVIGWIIASVVMVIKTLADTTIFLAEDLPNIPGLIVLGQIPEIDEQEGGDFQWKLCKGGGSRESKNEKEARNNEK